MKDSYGQQESRSIQITVSILSIHHEGPRFVFCSTLKVETFLSQVRTLLYQFQFFYALPIQLKKYVQFYPLQNVQHMSLHFSPGVITETVMFTSMVLKILCFNSKMKIAQLFICNVCNRALCSIINYEKSQSVYAGNNIGKQHTFGTQLLYCWCWLVRTGTACLTVKINH